VQLLTVVALLTIVGVKPSTPGAPELLSCPLMTDTATEVTVRLKAQDPKKRDVSYLVDWGDGRPASWTDYIQSGSEREEHHTYDKTGTMIVRARARAHAFATPDTMPSDWSRPCTLNVVSSLIKWVFPVPAGTFCAPALDSNGNVYFGDEEVWFYSLTPEGKLRWRFRVSDTLEGAISAGAAVGNNTVYFPCEDMHIYALTLDGKLLWSYKTASAAVAAPALGADGMIYASDDSGMVYCLNNQGILRWSFLTQDEIDNGLTIGPDGTIYVPADSMYALSPAGKKLWATGAQEEDNPFYSATFGPDGNLYGGNKDGYLYCLDRKTGGIIWRAAAPDEDEIHGEPVFGPDNTVYFGSDDYTISAKLKDGSPQTLIETDDKVQSTPAVNAKGTIYFLSLDGFFYALTPGGKVKWSKQIASVEVEWIPCSPVIAPDGTVYIGSFQDAFYAFQGDGAPLNGKWSMIRGDARHTGRAPQTR